jgi:polyhydroxyalkanoate synthase subunit PhaC
MQQTARTGPRPLPLHLASAATIAASSLAALPLARHGSIAWSKSLQPQAHALAPSLAAADPDALTRGLAAAVLAQHDAMLRGIERYRTHPYRRDLPDPPVVWQRGGARLLDYGGDGRVVLCVCSLINRAYVLDLSRRRSLLRWLAARGLRPLLLDWGEPDSALDLDRCMTQLLEPALDAAVAASGGPVALLGYCMGGTLAVALATRRPEAVRALALLSAPWDFACGDPTGVARALARFDPVSDAPVPLDLLQGYFALLDPGLAQRKFAAFADADDDQAADFVAIEDWLNDGVALPAGVARDCLREWYGTNAPRRGSWRIAGRTVLPGRLRIPSLVVVPGSDRIVPPACAALLAEAIPGAKQLKVDGGHIGMVVGPRAEALLWQPLGDWLSRATAAARRRPPTAPARRRTARSRPAAAGAAVD